MVEMLNSIAFLTGVVCVLICMRERGRWNMVQYLPCIIVWVKCSRWKGKSAPQKDGGSSMLPHVVLPDAPKANRSTVYFCSATDFEFL